MALNDSCHLLIETKHHFIKKSGGLEQNLGGGLEPLNPIASAATGHAGPAACNFLPDSIKLTTDTNKFLK